MAKFTEVGWTSDCDENEVVIGRCSRCHITVYRSDGVWERDDYGRLKCVFCLSPRTRCASGCEGCDYCMDDE